MLGLNINIDEYDVFVTFSMISDRFFDLTPKPSDDGWILVDYKPIDAMICSFLWAKKKSFNSLEE